MNRWWLSWAAALGIGCLSAVATAASRGEVLFRDPAGDQVGLYRESHALLIGESRYTRGWPNLESVPRELDLLEAALKEEAFQVVKRLNLTGQALRDAFVQFIRRYGRAPDNRLLFYFAGHGYTLERGWGREMGYIVPTDAPSPEKDPNGFKDNAVSMGQVLTWARDIDAKHALFVFDSCFSGSVFAARNLPKRPPQISRLTTEPVREFITAGSAGETVPARSVFTPAFVDALRYRLGDLDKDGYVTGMELGVYLQGKVPQYAEQTPQFGKIPEYELSRGDFVFEVGVPRVAAKAPETALTPEERRAPEAPPLEPAEAALRGFRDWLKDRSEGPEMVMIPAGSFRMGISAGEAGRDDDEGPVHEVEVAAFALGRYEVTVSEFRRFVDATRYRTQAETGGGCHYWDVKWLLHKDKLWRSPGFPQGDDHPVTCVSWNDALAYAEWLSKETGKGYRLPTEAEWEYAARAGTHTARYWGNDPDLACRYANVADRTAKETYPDWAIHDCTDGYVYTAPAGRFRPNGFGLYDMLGNVSEWTCSAYEMKYAGAERRCIPKGDGARRVFRGGSWGGEPRFVRSANRGRFTPGLRNFFLGFRLARTP
jgi:formylglycine-generating enzyme required for sulfatase activity